MRAMASSTACSGLIPSVMTRWTALPQTCSCRIRFERHSLSRSPTSIRCGRILYRRRGQTVEPVFGQMKETQGADRFMVRGLTACAGEWTLHCVAHNLKKLHAHCVRRAGTAR